MCHSHMLECYFNIKFDEGINDLIIIIIISLPYFWLEPKKT